MYLVGHSKHAAVFYQAITCPTPWHHLCQMRHTTMPRRSTKIKVVVVTEEQRASWDEGLRCAGEFASHLQKPQQIEIRVFGSDQLPIKTFFVPLELLTVRAPNLVVNHIGYDQEARISCLHVANATAAAAVEIFVYWVFTGYMPAAAKYLKEATDSTVTQQQQISPIRPWLEAWVLGLDYNVPNFRNAVMSRISKTMLHRPVIPTWLPGLDDFNYVQERVPDPATPCLQHLKTAMHMELVGTLEGNSIGIEEFSELVEDENVARSFSRTFAWLFMSRQQWAERLGVDFGGQKVVYKKGDDSDKGLKNKKKRKGNKKTDVSGATAGAPQ